MFSTSHIINTTELRGKSWNQSGLPTTTEQHTTTTKMHTLYGMPRGAWSQAKAKSRRTRKLDHKKTAHHHHKNKQQCFPHLNSTEYPEKSCNHETAQQCTININVNIGLSGGHAHAPCTAGYLRFLRKILGLPRPMVDRMLQALWNIPRIPCIPRIDEGNLRPQFIGLPRGGWPQ